MFITISRAKGRNMWSAVCLMLQN